jgi:lipopolysaccharide export system permease protein
MLLIDRYLVRQFVWSLAVCFCSLLGLFIVIQTFSNLDEFVSQGSKEGGLLGVLFDYYAYQSLAFFDSVSGILTLIAAMFTMAGFQRHNELTALMAAGIPKWRIVQPVIIAVAVVSCMAAVNRELVIPMFREKLSRTTKDFQGDTAKRLEPRRDHRRQVFLNGQETVAKTRQIRQPTFQLLPVELTAYGTQLIADDAFYQDADGERPGGYLLRGMQHPNDLDQKPSLSLNGEAVIITPRDAPWLQPNECFVVSDVTFEQLAGGVAWRQYSSTMEMIAGLHNSSLDFGADVRVAIHSRLVQPLLDMTLLFLGLPLILSRQTRNMFLAIGLAVGVVIAFMLVVMGFQYLGSQYLISPALAAWCPLLFFVPTAVGMSDPLRQ